MKEEIIGTLKKTGDLDPLNNSATTLQFVKELRAQHLGHELPTFSPYSALERLIEKFKGKWRDAAEECLDRVKEQLHELALVRVAKTFDQFPDMQVRVR